MAKKLKKPTFPVKQFYLPGGTLTEKERVAVVREALGKSQGKSKATGDAANVARTETASGKGEMSFVVFSLDQAGKTIKVHTVIGPRSKASGSKSQKKVRVAVGAAKPAGARAEAQSKRASQKPRKSV